MTFLDWYGKILEPHIPYKMSWSLLVIFFKKSLENKSFKYQHYFTMLVVKHTSVCHVWSRWAQDERYNIDFNMIDINPVPGFQLVMLSFVGKKTCFCWFYIVDQLKQNLVYITHWELKCIIQVNSDMKENLIFFIYRVLKCDVIKMKFLKLWDLSG